MRRLAIVLSLIFLLITSGCTSVQETKEPTKVTEELTAEPTGKPIAEPTATITPEPTVTQEPTSTPEPTAKPEPEIKPSLKASDIDELFENVADSAEIKEAPMLVIPDNYLGNGIPGDFYLQDYAVVDDDGNVYYTDFRHIYLIDSDTGTVTKILENENIGNKFDFDFMPSRPMIRSIYCKDNKIYAYITLEYKEFEYTNILVDIFEESILYSTEEDIDFSYDSRVIRNYFDKETKFWVHNQYTLRGNAHRTMFDVTAKYSKIDLSYVSDKYLFCTGSIYSRDGTRSYLDYRHLLIIDKDTMKTAAIIKDEELNLFDTVILLCKDEWMLFYDKNEEAVMIYNIIKGEIKTYWKFGGTNTYLGYNPDEYCVYIRKSTGYSHLENTFTPQEPHYFFEQCISEEELPNATEIFVKYNLLTLEEEILNTVKSADYMSRYLCFDSIDESVVGDYLVVYSYVMEESYVPLSFEQKFKLGEDIDYYTWRD